MRTLNNASLSVESVKPEPTETTAQLLEDYKRSTIEFNAIQNEEELNELLIHTGECSIETLNAISGYLGNTEAVSQLTYESIVSSLDNISDLTDIPYNRPEYDPEKFDANKDILLEEMQTTIEGFFGDLVRGIKQTTRTLLRSLGNFVSGITKRQGLITKLAKKLKKAYNTRAESDVSNKKIKSKWASKWFNSPDDVDRLMETYTGLRKASIQGQDKFEEFITPVPEERKDTTAILNSINKVMDSYKAVPGIESKGGTAKQGDKVANVNSVLIPGPNGRSLGFYVTSFMFKGILPFWTAVHLSGHTAFALKAIKATAYFGKAVFATQAVIATAFGVAVVAGAYQLGKAIHGWISLEELPALNYAQIGKTLDGITAMDEDKVTLSGLNKIITKVEKQITKLDTDANSTAEIKGATKSAMDAIKVMAKLMKTIYTNSVDLVKSAYGYCIESLKKHRKGSVSGVETTEDVKWYAELDAISSVIHDDYMPA